MRKDLIEKAKQYPHKQNNMIRSMLFFYINKIIFIDKENNAFFTTKKHLKFN